MICVKIFLRFISISLKMDLTLNLRKKSDVDKGRFYLKNNMDNRVSSCFRILILKKVSMLFSNCLDMSKILNADYKRENPNISVKSGLILCRILRNFLYMMGNCINIQKSGSAKNFVDINDIINAKKFSDFFDSSNEIFFFRRFNLTKLNINSHYEGGFKILKSTEYSNKSTIINIKERQKNAFYFDYRCLLKLKKKYIYRLRT
nr:hypothetical protein 1634Bnrm3_p135 [Cryptomonas sp.]